MKPENVLLSGDEDANGKLIIKLTDFGLATPFKEGEKLKEFLGSEMYMAPGVLKGSYDYHVDIWGIGIITHILLCGCAPFDGETKAKV